MNWRRLFSDNRDMVGRNVEIKARAGDLGAVRAAVEGLADQGPEVIEQADTFFECARGRLKLRRLSQSRGELIYYERADSTDPAEATYVICPTDEPELLTDVLSRAFGVKGVVRKRRTVYLVGQTRVHLDEVEGLGQFVELEVVLDKGQSAAEGRRIVRDLMAQLGLRQADLVEKAYIDLAVS